MATELYLDTARFGRMRLRAQEAEHDFARLCGAEGGSIVIEELLRSGIEACPESMRRRYPGLAHWGGIRGLKQSARELLGTPEEPEVLIAGRSGTLMRLAARALFSRCRRVLLTDMEWPPYAAILREEARRVDGQVGSVEIEDRIRIDGLGRQEVVDLVTSEYRRHGCDGLFLSAVSFRGINVPVEAIMSALEGPDAPRFLAVDGAQALGHMPWDSTGCDILLAGAHKWLRSGRPLGLGYLCTSRSRQALKEVAGEAGCSSELGDPLYGLVGQLEGGNMEPLGETADLSGLFCASAAVSAESRDPGDAASRFEERMANSVALAEATERTGWRPVVPGPRLRSGILMLRNETAGAEGAPADRVRAAFHRRGVALSAYRDGLIRLSMPQTHWLDDELDHLRTALKRCR